MQVWNKKNLDAPFVSSYKTSPKEIDIKPLIGIFREASTFYSNQTFLEKETALLSRCIYRTKTKFRSDKGNKEMQKLNRALLQYLNMNFAYHVNNFNEMLPESNDPIFYMPTKNLLDYVLVRLQGVLRLMNRAIECSKRAALYIEKKMPLGQFWKVDFICIAIISRLRTLTVDIMNFSWRFFNSAVSYSSLLKNTVPQWLDTDYKFSLNLKDYVSDMCWNDIKSDEHFQTVVKQEPTFSEMFSSSNVTKSERKRKKYRMKMNVN